MNKFFNQIYLILTIGFFTLPVAASYTHPEFAQGLLEQTQFLEQEALENALVAFSNAKKAGLSESDLFTIIDYSQPSNKPRLWVFDLAQSKLVHEELVAHGRGSGGLYAEKFSNTPESYQSSLGLFKTADPYQGRNGYSLRLKGLEEGINHLAHDRAIVIHGANYVKQDFINAQGRLGRSHGCPAVDPAINKELIDLIKGGSLVFIYYPDNKYLAESEFMQKEVRVSWFNRLGLNS
jgi:hypothetical protein